jgi:diguanylate cyclase (GGDEF)-like protein
MTMTTDEEHRRDFRLAIAGKDTPTILLWAGILIVILTSLSYAMEPAEGVSAHAADFTMGLVFIAAGITLPHLSVPPRLIPRIFAVLVTMLVMAFLEEIWMSPSALAMAYVLVVMCAFGPSSLAWLPFSVAASVMVAASAVVSYSWAGDKWLDWTFAAVGAVLIGALILRARMRSINALADASALIERLATTDRLSGALNRHGLAMQLDGLAANARRLEQLLFVAFVDIDGLKQANDDFGHDFGDDVIVAVAHAVSATVREGDLVARWGGDELIVVGIGVTPDDQAFSERLRENIVATGIDLDRWPGAVSVGMASGSPSVMTVDDLISAADADMYQRRQVR